MSDEELEEARKQHERAERHHAHLKRRRQRQKEQLLAELARVMAGLEGSLPGCKSVWHQYSPLLEGLSEEWRAAGGGGALAAERCASGGDGGYGSSSGGDAAGGVVTEGIGEGSGDAGLEAVLRRMPPRLRRVVRQERLERALAEALPGSSPPAGPIALAASPSTSAVEFSLLFDWAAVPAPCDPALGGRLADADVVRAGGGRMNLRALRKRVQVEGFALALLQLLPGMRRRRQQQQQQQQHRHVQSLGEGAAAGGTRSSGGGGDGEEPLYVVDFGSGGGNLALPLAWLFEEAGCSFVAVDLKPAAVEMVVRRAKAAGLANVSADVCAIEDYSGPADAALALHACGAATDYAMQQAVARGAAFIASPCCIGKVNLGGAAGPAAAGRAHAEDSEAAGGRSGAAAATEGPAAGGSGAGLVGLPVSAAASLVAPAAALPPLRRPRSLRLGEALAALSTDIGGDAGGAGGGSDRSSSCEEECKGEAGGPERRRAEGPAETACALFSALARVADFSHQEDHGYPDLAGAAKAHVELDRALAAGEEGYEWRLARLPQPELTAKSDVILGWPAEM